MRNQITTLAILVFFAIFFNVGNVMRDRKEYFTGQISAGQAIGDTEKLSQPPEKTNILTDIEGNSYKIITLGGQTWMAENLKTTKFSDSTSIPLVTYGPQWQILSTPGYCWYQNDAKKFSKTYGALYNWHAVNSGKLCPAGWHVPEDAEWTRLEGFLIAQGYNYDGSTTGNKIAKSLADTNNWYSSYYEGSPGRNDYSSYRNKTGFSALPGGVRNDGGLFLSVTEFCIWWSYTEGDTTKAWTRNLGYAESGINRRLFDKNLGCSVRCVMD
jgi:uncharacterized protein (TIGR02145 family)